MSPCDVWVNVFSCVVVCVLVRVHAGVSVCSCFFFQFNQTGRGSVCSQAIMLVTDGAVDTYDAVFAKYNWPDRKVSCPSPNTPPEESFLTHHAATPAWRLQAVVSASP